MLRGTIVTLVITVPPAVAVQLTDDGGEMDASNWARLAFMAILLGFGVGGWVAARRQPAAPMAHGAAAAVLAWAVVQGVGIVRRAIADEPISWLTIVFAALLAASTGAVGGLVADRVRHHRRSRAAEPRNAA